jgi:polar amino acid transport system substrate-binding protein
MAMPVAAQPAQVPACDPTASLRPAGPPVVTAGSFMAKIRARGFLIAGVGQTTFHFGYLNPLDGKIEGFDIDIVRAIAAAIFGNPDKVEFRAVSSAQRISDIQSGEADIVASTMTITCARLQQVDFSTVYFDAGQRVLVPINSPVTSIADLGGKKVCAATGSTSIANLRAAPSHPIPVAAPYSIDCLVLLQQGDVAAISTDDSILAGLAAQDPRTKIVGPRFSNEPYGLAISQQHPDFVRFVNAVLQRLRADGQWAASYARWIGTPAPPPPPARYKP